MPFLQGIAMKVHVPFLIAILVGAGVLAPRALAQCEVQKLTASDAGEGDWYGYAVALDGTTALVGAYLNDDVQPNSGTAYIYELTASGWVETAKLVAGDPDLGDTFGQAVALSGNTALVTADGDNEAGPGAGAAYIFERTAGVWVQTQKLFASDAGGGAFWGESASMSGDRAIIGNRLADAAYVFERTGGVWLEVAKLTASDGASYDWFGVSVSISEDGETVIVGSYQDDDACVNDSNCNSGSAYIFERTPGGWVETGKLTASDGEANDNFGYSVAISAGTAVVGSPSDNAGGIFSGSAYVFGRSQTGSWGPHETVKIGASDADLIDFFGQAVAISGDSILVGAHNDDTMGSVYLFERDLAGWAEGGKFLAGDRSLSDLFGCPVAICGEAVIIGALGDDDACPLDIGCNSGSAYVFTIRDPLGQNYCGPAVPNSSGDPAEIHACGSASVASNDLLLRAEPVPNQPGIFFYGPQQANVPFGNGTLCIAGQVGRLDVVNATGNVMTFLLDNTSPPSAATQITAGSTWNFQAWFRDPAALGAFFNLSNGLSVVFLP